MTPYKQVPDLHGCRVAGMHSSRPRPSVMTCNASLLRHCPGDQGWHLSQLQMRPLAGHRTFMWKSCIKPVLQSTACWGTGGCQRCRLHRGSTMLRSRLYN